MGPIQRRVRRLRREGARRAVVDAILELDAVVVVERLELLLEVLVAPRRLAELVLDGRAAVRQVAHDAERAPRFEHRLLLEAEAVEERAARAGGVDEHVRRAAACTIHVSTCPTHVDVAAAC